MPTRSKGGPQNSSWPVKLWPAAPCKKVFLRWCLMTNCLIVFSQLVKHINIV